MKVIIPYAIKERRLLRLIYDGRARTVEPHVLGLIDGKYDVMLCWQVSPPVRGGDHWHLFHLDKISGLRTLEERFELSPHRQASLDTFSHILAAHYNLDAQACAEPPDDKIQVLPTEESPQ